MFRAVRRLPSGFCTRPNDEECVRAGDGGAQVFANVGCHMIGKDRPACRVNGTEGPEKLDPLLKPCLRCLIGDFERDNEALFHGRSRKVEPDQIGVLI